VSEALAEIAVDARPGLFSFEPARTAALVVDMQNDYGADGGMFATAGLPID
jgi:ureidoacrylate peracid hydrolase